MLVFSIWSALVNILAQTLKNIRQNYLMSCCVNRKLVTIVDKRDGYSRDQWFDLIDEPFYKTVENLFDRLRFDTQYGHYVEERRGTFIRTILLPASILERFLAKTAFILGFDIKFKHEYLGYCSQFPHVSVIYNHKNNNKNNNNNNNNNDNEDIYDSNDNGQIWDCGDNFNQLQISKQNISSHLKNSGNFDSNDIYFGQFHLLVGSDGTHSNVRNLYDLGWYQQNVIDIARFVRNDAMAIETLTEKEKKFRNVLPQQVNLEITNLEQISLLINFKTVRYDEFSMISNLNTRNNHNNQNSQSNNNSNSNNNNGEQLEDNTLAHTSHNCPTLRMGDDNNVLDPWSSSFFVDGVDGVFKRFYFNDCQMQILLNHEASQKLLLGNNNGEDSNDGGDGDREIEIDEEYLWKVIFDAAKYYLIDAQKNIDDLKQNFLRSRNNGKNLE